MAKLHIVKKARKAIPSENIAVGDSYFWWKFPNMPKRIVSKNKPRRSQLTQSEFLGAIYDIEDSISALRAGNSLPDEVRDIADRVRQLGEECEEKRNNMPESLQDGATGDLLQERHDACETFADELESVDFDEPEEEEARDKYWQEKLEEIQNLSIEC